MTTLLRLFVASLRRVSSRLRARLARKLAVLSRGAARLLAAGVPGGLAQRLCQVAVACGLAAVVAGGIGGAVQAGGGGSTFRVSDRSYFNEFYPSVARDADGDYVVVWEVDDDRDGDGYGIYARRYNSADQPMGPSFRVNSTTVGDQYEADVAMSPNGNFVVTWNSGDGDGLGIFGQRFDKDGAPLGGEFRINQHTANEQLGSKVAMDMDGGFVVVWSSLNQVSSGASWDAYGRRYNADGTPAGGEFLINQTTVSNQSRPAVAMDRSGNFTVAWMDYSSGDFDIYRRSFAADGTALSGEILVNRFTATNQMWPDIAMSADGDYVIVWEGRGETYVSYSSYFSYDINGVFARRYTANGTPVNSDFRVNDYATNAQFNASVSMDADGNFVVSWVERYGSSYGDDVKYRLFHADAPVSDVVNADGGSVYAYGNGFASATDVAMDADGDYVVVVHQVGTYFSAHYGSYYYNFNVKAYSSRFEGDGESAAPMVGGVFLKDDHHHLTAGETLARHFQSLVVSFSREMDSVDVTNTGNWSLTRNGSNVAVQSVLYYYNPFLWRYEAQVNFGVQPQGDGNYVLTLNGGVEGENGVALGANLSLAFRVRTPRARGNNVLVDTTDSNAFFAPAVARDADGDFVVAWHVEDRDGDSYGIYARRYNASGAPQGAIFQVNQTTDYDQRNPAVAMDPDGNFVVVWDGYGDYYSYDDQGVWARVFNADGTPHTDEFLVNVTTFGNQSRPSVAMDYDGNFVVAWQGYGSVYSWDNQGIFFRRFDFDGNSLSPERRANDPASESQYTPAVAMDKDGDFVIAWQGYYSGSATIFLNKFDNDGRRVMYYDVVPGREGSPGLRYQYLPAVAMDDDGDFVVVWNEYSSDYYYYPITTTGAYLVRGRKFSGSVQPEGPAFAVHAAPVDPYYADDNRPSVAMDADGDFVVAFSVYTYVSIASSSYDRSDALVRRYNAQGVAQGPAVQVNNSDARYNWRTAVAMDADGNFVVAYNRDEDFSSYYSVMFQLFEGNNPPTTSGIPDQVMDEDSAPLVINLASFFSDVEDGSGGLVYSVVGNTNAALVVPGISGSNLGLALIPDAFGTADITIRATDTDGLSVEDTFTLTVNDVAEPGPIFVTKTKKGGCAAENTGPAPWGLLAVFAMLLGSLRGLVRRRQS